MLSSICLARDATSNWFLLKFIRKTRLQKNSVYAYIKINYILLCFWINMNEGQDIS